MQPFEEYASLWDGRVQLAVELAKQAGNLTRDHYFQTDAYQTERKRDNSPVTTADKEAEQLIRRILGDRFPQDGILGKSLERAEGNRITNGSSIQSMERRASSRVFLCTLPWLG